MVAILIAVKGVLVLLLGLGLLAFIHRDVEEIAEHLIYHYSISPNRRLSRMFLNAAASMSDTKILLMAGFGMVYSTVRFIEAWGLWRERAWAEWLVIASAGLYLPWEIYECIHKPTLGHFAILAGNLAIIAYLGAIRLEALREKARFRK